MDLRLNPVFYSQVLHLRHSTRPNACLVWKEDVELVLACVGGRAAASNSEAATCHEERNTKGT